MKTKGYHILESTVPPHICDNILKEMNNHIFTSSFGKHKIKGMDFKNVESNTYHITNQQYIAEIPEIQNLLTESIILNVVQEYLGCCPVNTQTNCWWSVPNNKPVSKSNSKIILNKKKSAAQMFHQDFDHPKFVKLFLYLNDIESDNGPHTFVEGSSTKIHPNLPKEYQLGKNPWNRLKDSFVKERYGDGKIKEFTGKKGTIIIEDTRGFHKGKELQNGHRSLIQFEFASIMFYSLFNKGVRNNINSDKFSNKFKQFVKLYPRTYMRFE